jgi:hypothetical protein
MSKVQYDPIELKGGWDQTTPTLALPPGVLKGCQNFEVAVTGGYSRIGGYERYDGRTAPSAATYTVVQISAFTNTPTLGQTLTGNTSGATGTIIALGANYIVLTKVVGAFTETEVVKVGGTTIGTAVPFTASISALLAAQYLAAAADVYRALIAKPTGSGAIRGVFTLNVSGTDYTYCFRDNAGATAVNLWQATAGGWTQVVFKYTVSFTAGGASAPADGATLTQGGVTATVRRVVAQSGSWASNTAAGQLVIDAPSGGNFAAGAATLTGGINVTLSGVQTQITMAAGGKFEFDTGNFTGQPSGTRIYGVDGVNKMFEFDGTTLVPIATGATPDAPRHVVVYHNYLMCSVEGSLIYCGVGTPYRYSATDGGGEIATGDTITGFALQPGAQTTAALAVYCRAHTTMLYGTSPSTFNLTVFNVGAGAIERSIQNLNQTYVLDDRGVTSLATTLAYGNFTAATLTNNLRPFIYAAKMRLNCSAISRDKSQYRLFFSDGTGLYTTLVNNKLLGHGMVMFPTAMNVAWTAQLANGTEVTYLGGSDGMVYTLDTGSSFDGSNLDAYITLTWNATRSPRILKRYRHASVEVQGNYYAAFSFGYQLAYNSSEIPQGSTGSYTSGFTAAPNWDSFTWDSFTWDGTTISPTEISLSGTGENIQITISSSTNYIQPYTLNSIILHYSIRRGLR